MNRPAGDRSQRRRPRRPATVHGRLRVVMVAIAMVLSVFGVRLVQLQGIDPQSYAAQARAAGARSEVLPAKRGTIEDRNGEPLAESADTRLVVADPTATKEFAPTIAHILADRLAVDYFATLTKLRKPGTRFQVLQHQVPATTAERVVARIRAAVHARLLVTDPTRAKDPFVGVYTRREPNPVRTHPGDDVAANVLGFLNAAGQAQGGLELSFDKWLAGTNGRETFESAGGNRVPLGDNSTTEPRNGRPLRLTIDRDTQWYVQQVLRQAVQSSGGDSGSAVVMATRTGSILALADYPSYDANDSGSAKQADLGARSLTDSFEPGSVEKVLTFGALTDAHKVSPRTKITVPPTLALPGATIHDYFVHDVLHLTATGVIAKSSNIGTSLAVTQMSAKQLRGYLLAFGLGQRSDIGMPLESAGYVPPLTNGTWPDLSRATISFGQGISVNTLQMATAINAVANGGVLVSPSLVEGSATTSAGVQVGTDHATTRRVISRHAATQVARMMQSVPNPETGTAPGAQVPDYLVSGKTGTAQRANAKCKCYDGTFTTSFAGFVPSDEPAFTVYVVVQNPRNGGGGGSIGGPAFSKIESFLLQRFGVAPTLTKPADLPIEW